MQHPFSAALLESATANPMSLVKSVIDVLSTRLILVLVKAVNHVTVTLEVLLVLNATYRLATAHARLE